MKKGWISLFLAVALLALASCNEAEKTFEKAENAYFSEDYSEASRLYKRALSQGYGDSDLIQAKLSLALFQSGEEADANTRIEALLKKDLSSEVLKTAGIFYFVSGNDESALDAFKRSISENGSDKDPETAGFIGEILFRTGKPLEALEYFNALILQNFERISHEIMAGECYLSVRQFEAASAYFDMLEAEEGVKPSHYAAVYRKCVKYEAYETGLVYFRKGLSLIESGSKEMTESEFYYVSGKLKKDDSSAETNTATEALAAAEKAILNKEYDEAEKALDKCLSLDPNSAYAYNGLFMLKVLAGDTTGAQQMIPKILALGNEKVIQNMRWNEFILYEMKEDFEKAMECLKEYLRNYPDDTAALAEKAFLERGY